MTDELTTLDFVGPPNPKTHLKTILCRAARFKIGPYAKRIALSDGTYSRDETSILEPLGPVEGFRIFQNRPQDRLVSFQFTQGPFIFHAITENYDPTNPTVRFFLSNTDGAQWSDNTIGMTEDAALYALRVIEGKLSDPEILKHANDTNLTSEKLLTNPERQGILDKTIAHLKIHIPGNKKFVFVRREPSEAPITLAHAKENDFLEEPLNDQMVQVVRFPYFRSANMPARPLEARLSGFLFYRNGEKHTVNFLNLNGEPVAEFISTQRSLKGIGRHQYEPSPKGKQRLIQIIRDELSPQYYAELEPTIARLEQSTLGFKKNPTEKSKGLDLPALDFDLSDNFVLGNN